MMSKLKYRLIKFLVRHSDHDSLIGDFVEIYDDTARQAGKLSAARWYWFQVFRLFPAAFNHQFILWGTMFNNYLKTTYRNFKKHPAFSFINILGLTLGMACALLIFSFVNYELSVDSFHKEPENIYQVFVHEDFYKNPTTQVGLAPEMKEKMPEVQAFTRFSRPWGQNFMTLGDITHNENQIRFVDPSFFDVFHFPLLKGDPAAALNHPDSIIISKEIAGKYFGNQNPIGKTLIFNHKHPLTVTGILDSLPINTSLRFNMLIPMIFDIQRKGDWFMDWNNLFVYTFIRCQRNSSPDKLIPLIGGILKKHGNRGRERVNVIPLKERYFRFYSDKTVVMIFSVIAIFILLIACFNFMNLSTARSTKRAREIGMRKMVGAGKGQIVSQFLGESIVLSLIAAFLSVLINVILHPLLGNLTGRAIGLEYSFILKHSLLLSLATGFVAGIYPAFFLSNFKIIRTIKEKGGEMLKGNYLRRISVIFQFVLSILIITFMMVVQRQKEYIQDYDIGYNKKNIVCVPMGGGSEKFYQPLKNELLKDFRIKKITATAVQLPIFHWRQGGFDWEGKDPDFNILASYNAVDYQIIATMEMELIEGEDFIPGKSHLRSFIVNEEMARIMGKTQVVGMNLRKGDRSGKIVGVVKNFHFNSMRNKIEPLVLELLPQTTDDMLIRIQGKDIPSELNHIARSWKKIIPQYPFRYTFLEDDYRSSITGLAQTGQLLTVFSILAILISCMGLFGLSSYAAVQKTREIGIRKVMGASVYAIIKTISREFIQLVVIANILVWPLAYHLLTRWLYGFSYRTRLSWEIFIFTGIFTLGISLLTIGYQTIKAARTNPVQSLRYE